MKIQMKKKFILTCMIIAILGLLLFAPIESVTADTSSNLEITNLFGVSFNFSTAQLLAMPKTMVNAALYCDGALTTSGNWSGVLLSYLLTQAQITPEVSSIQLVASDGYKVAIPIDLALQPQIIIAYEKDDQPIAEGLRLIVPGANGATWVALITTITMSTTGVDYPQAVTVGSGTFDKLIPAQTGGTRETPTQQQVTLQPQPTTKANSSSNHQTSHSNVTDPYQLTAKRELINENLSLQTVIVYALAVAASTALTATAYMVYRQKRKHMPQNH
jgi:DMSO/TMAO reductase YedYZ molybdopterin-dependent catalytic subunit